MFVSSMYFAIEHEIVCMYIDDCSDDDSQQVLLAMGIVVGVLFLALCTSIGCNIFQGKKIINVQTIIIIVTRTPWHTAVTKSHKMKTEPSSIPADVPTAEVTEGNAVMYDEIGMNHFMHTTANEIPLTKNSAYSSTSKNTST